MSSSIRTTKKNEITSKEYINEQNNNEKQEEDNNKTIDDKISFCHFTLLDGEDVDITRKKAIECYEQSSNFILFKKFTKSKKIIFIDENFLYILKDVIVDKNDEKKRRVSKKFDISKLCNIEAKEENKKLVYKLQFLKNDYFDRESRIFIFDEAGSTLFYEQLVDVLEKVESTFFNDEDENEEEEEEDDDNNNINLEDSANDVDMSAKNMNRIVFNDKDNNLISSSRKKII